jgi:hypothetical protein
MGWCGLDSSGLRWTLVNTAMNVWVSSVSKRLLASQGLGSGELFY